MTDSEALSRLDGGVEEWASWRAGQRDGQIDLAEADLSAGGSDGFDLSGADLRGADLTCRARWCERTWRTRAWRTHSLQESNLSNGPQRATLDGSRCSRAQMGGATMHGGSAAPISAAFRATGSRWARSCPPIPGARISPARGSNRAWLPSAQLSGVVLDDAEARHATFSEASLAGLSAQRADCHRSDFERAWLDGANFELRNADARKPVGRPRARRGVRLGDCRAGPPDRTRSCATQTDAVPRSSTQT